MADQTLPIGGALDVTPHDEAQKGTFLEWLHGWVITVDHKRLGILYVTFALFFLLVAGLEALAIRVQLAMPNNHFVSPELYNRLFTMHGTTMIFLVGMPILFGFANYIVPLQIGARDMAFPRLNAFSFWLTAFGGLLLYWSFVGGFGLFGAGTAPDVGWFAYAPLTERAFSIGHAMDYWAVALIISGWGTLGTAINIVATTVSMRCKGMTLMRMPLFTWLMLVVSALTLVTITPLTAAQIMLMIDRYLGGHFFDTQAGGSAVVWMHFFWIFGHPEVYVLALPAFGIASEIIPVFSRKAIFGYPAMVAASAGIGFVSLGVWAHHMFTVGMNGPTTAFFVLSTMLVGIPTGIKIFNWTATLIGGKIWFATPMLFCLGFLIQFLIAGLTGIMLACAPWDWQLHNSYFVVAHFHYVLVGGIVFNIFAAIYYWFPKATGKMLSETLGKWHFWLFLLGFHLTFDTMHIPGILGMPRHIYTYEADRGWGVYNFIETIGAFVQAIAVLIFVYNIVISLMKGQDAGSDPWDAWTLEWAVPSPPPSYNFVVDPVVNSRRPLWDLKHPEDPDWKYE
ncbi:MULTISPECIES: cytochrome c oxidase subunit I [Acidobacterium]|uniref:Cytochrome c oxidase subunit 1 n=1 Tax=Acidobacterium capsulatum (strain ATCC 51196 / DSM 11244 / BCRC 80197 / JCM 7670 / NBRC 15755 / NCIMB 13165 / 161) TaxID=240015 RepID=C1F1D0_ACIC5|nr:MULTISPECIES: cytochrome c oxidase subunit I [Acidobacterium]ACO33715.1 cytochrome c oxidase, subunit 1 [Acidobacterium capsulatum ATCC 51196]HCT62458.1 cytochrome c oxidase subunit I [Acidobacterium sp.]